MTVPSTPTGISANQCPAAPSPSTSPTPAGKPPTATPTSPSGSHSNTSHSNLNGNDRMLHGVLTLHDIRDVESFCADTIPKTWTDQLAAHDHEELLDYLIVIVWELSRNKRWHTSFSGWVTPRLHQRRHDWLRKRNGRTVWKFAHTEYRRELPTLLEYDDTFQSADVDPAEHLEPDGEWTDSGGNISPAAYLPPRGPSASSRIRQPAHTPTDRESCRGEAQAA